MENPKANEDLKAAQEAEFAAGQEHDEKLANSMQDIEVTRATLSADAKFLMDLKDLFL